MAIISRNTSGDGNTLYTHSGVYFLIPTTQSFAPIETFRSCPISLPYCRTSRFTPVRETPPSELPNLSIASPRTTYSAQPEALHEVE